MAKAFVCGHPIAHSRSPLIHGHWLARYGIAGSYEPIDVAPESFAEFVSSISRNGFAGGNVTLPHKEAAFRAAASRDEAAEDIGAVNTLWFEDGRLRGGNTDAYGFAANLDDRAPGWDARASTAVVLGAGGAARAVLYALKQRGFSDIRMANRTVDRAADLARHFGPTFSAHRFEAVPELLSDAAIVINTTSLGMHGDESSPPDLANLPDQALVTDIVYVPLETPLLAAARRRGLKTVDGLGMLLHQATPGFERWFGVQPEVTPELRDLIVADMAHGR